MGLQCFAPASCYLSNTRGTVIHNHLVVDAVGAVFPFGSDAFIRLRQAFWLQMFAEAAGHERPLIFTFAPEPTVPRTFVPEARAIVEGRGGRVCFVQLMIATDEQDRRIENADRGQFQKLRSVETLRRLRAQGWVDPEPPPADLTIDSAQVAAADAAQQIMRHFALSPLPQAHRQYAE